MKRVFLFSLLLLALLCSPLSAETPGINDVYVIHFVLDGLNYDVLNELIDEGRLPTVKNRFVDHGAVFTQAVSNFPSVSTTVYQSFTTGLFPGNAGIPFLERFDREKKKVVGYLTAGGYLKINDDLKNFKTGTTPITIFEYLEGYPTLSLYSAFRRGASDYFPKRLPLRALLLAATDASEKIDMLAYKKLFKIFKSKNIPRYTLVGLYATDLLGHEHGAKSVDVQGAVIQFDRFLREFLKLLDECKIADKTYIIVSADHGMHDSGKYFNLTKELKKAGIFVKPGNPKIKNYSLYAADRGVSSTQIYVKHDGNWDPIENADILRRHLGIDLIQTLLNFEPVELVIARDGKGKVRIFDPQGGESHIECLENSARWCGYRVEQGRTDPLHYKDNPKLSRLLDKKAHSASEWLNATANEKYPDAVTALSQIFESNRAGDLFVVTKQGWSFKKVKAATHGSLIRDDMHIPMMITGPDVPNGTFSTMRACDIFALLIKWFGLSVPKENYDGVDPFKT